MEKVISHTLLSLLLLGLSLGCATPDKGEAWESDGDYYSYYGLNTLRGDLAGAHIGEGENALWTWSSAPENPGGTVFFLHGYLDHSALSLKLFRFLNDRHYRVVTYDLPGHGRSGGPRGGMDGFGEYRESLERVMDYWDLGYEDTLFLGHSTGGALILDRLLAGKTMKGAALAAPLIRFAHYDGAVFLLDTLFRGKTSVRVSRRPSTSDGAYNRKKREDPLGIERMPLDWSRDIIAWEQNLPRGIMPCETPLLVLQGERDWVVQYRENLPRISRWFPESRILCYPGLKHSLFNEAEAEGLYVDLEGFLLSLAVP